MLRLFFLLCFLPVTVIAVAQDDIPEEKGFQKEKLFVSGNFGLAFGDYTLVNISPQIGYRFNQYFAAGAGINAIYINLKRHNIYGNLFSKESQGVVGLNIFGRVYPVQFLMAQVQPEMNYLFGKIRYFDNRDPATTSLDAEIVPSILVGGGFVLGSQRSAMIISLMYDVLQKENSPYGNKAFVNFSYSIALFQGNR